MTQHAEMPAPGQMGGEGHQYSHVAASSLQRLAREAPFFVEVE